MDVNLLQAGPFGPFSYPSMGDVVKTVDNKMGKVVGISTQDANPANTFYDLEMCSHTLRPQKRCPLKGGGVYEQYYLTGIAKIVLRR